MATNSQTPRTTNRAAGPRTSRARRAGAKRANFLNYPRAGKEGAARWIPGWRVFVAGIVGFIAAGAVLFAIAWVTIDVPEPGDFALAQTTEVYYADGETPMGSYSEFNRENVPLDTLPAYVGHAVVASEDRRFYDNNGVDLVGTSRALINNLQGKPTQGGSTLTQQYVERYYLDTTTSLVGKFREAILALKINLQQPKEEVLENYLNTIYFGRGAYGIQTAAQEYFGVDAEQLTVSQSALLAGIIPAPSAWDPAKSPERAEQRWQRVMDLMLRDGWITQQQYDEAEMPQTVEPETNNTYAGPQGYLLEMVRGELRSKLELTDEQIDQAGYQITTTVNKAWQDYAIAAVAELPDSRPATNHVAMVSVEPTTGAIRMLYGGDDYLTRARNGVTQDAAQAGSIFKPFTMVAALEDGASLYRRYNANSPMRVRGWESPVRNYLNHSWGTINMITATENSVNTYYAQLNRDVGPQRTVDAAVAAGLPEDTPGLEAFPSNVLGPASVRPIDMARAYGTFASGGIRHDPYIVAEITDRDGNVVYTAGGEGTRVFDEDVMADATYAMEQVVRGGSATKLRAFGRDIAGKTGTSSDNRSAWFVGYIPQMVTVVAMYESDENGNEMPLQAFGGVREITGSTYPVDLWRYYMAPVLQEIPAEAFPPPSTGKRDTLNRTEPGPRATTRAPRATRPAPAPTTQAPVPEPTQEPTIEEPTQEEPTQEQPPEGEQPPGDGAGQDPGTQQPAPPPATQPTEGTQPQGGEGQGGPAGAGGGGEGQGGGGED